jgi:hypothetical protein
MPLVGLTSLTRVEVPHVDLPFKYALFLVTRSDIFHLTFKTKAKKKRNTDF